MLPVVLRQGKGEEGGWFGGKSIIWGREDLWKRHALQHEHSVCIISENYIRNAA